MNVRNGDLLRNTTRRNTTRYLTKQTKNKIRRKKFQTSMLKHDSSSYRHDLYQTKY